MDEINPKIVNDEPECNREKCDFFNPQHVDVCEKIEKQIFIDCIPGIRQQRDRLKVENDELKEIISAIQSWIRVAHNDDKKNLYDPEFMLAIEQLEAIMWEIQ